MKTIVALDPGKHNGLVALNYHGEGKFSNVDQHETSRVDEVIKFIRQHKPDTLIIEGFISNGGRCKDVTAIEIIAIVKYVFKGSRIKIVIQSPSCQVNQKAESVSRHCASAMKHALHYIKKVR